MVIYTTDNTIVTIAGRRFAVVFFDRLDYDWFQLSHFYPRSDSTVFCQRKGPTFSSEDYTPLKRPLRTMSPTVTDKAHRTQQFPNGKVSFPVSLRIGRVNLLSKSSKFAFNEVNEAGANNLMHFCGDVCIGLPTVCSYQYIRIKIKEDTIHEILYTSGEALGKFQSVPNHRGCASG